MLKEFREFIARGNVLDLAVAVIIGAAFGKIVTSLVEGVLMPPLGLVLGSVDFSSLFIVLDQSKAHARVFGAGQDGRRTGHCLRGLSERRRQLPYPGFRHLPAREAGESVEGPGHGDDESLPEVPVQHPDRCSPVRRLLLGPVISGTETRASGIGRANRSPNCPATAVVLVSSSATPQRPIAISAGQFQQHRGQGHDSIEGRAQRSGTRCGRQL